MSLSGSACLTYAKALGAIFGTTSHPHFPLPFSSEKEEATLAYQVTAGVGISTTMEARGGSSVGGTESTDKQQSQGTAPAPVVGGTHMTTKLQCATYVHGES